MNGCQRDPAIDRFVRDYVEGRGFPTGKRIPDKLLPALNEAMEDFIVAVRSAMTLINHEASGVRIVSESEAIGTGMLPPLPGELQKQRKAVA